MGEIGEWDEVGAENWGTIKVDDTYYAYYECIYDGVRHIGASEGVQVSFQGAFLA